MEFILLFFFKKKKKSFSIFPHFGHVKFYGLVRHLIVSLTGMEKSYPD